MAGVEEQVIGVVLAYEPEANIVQNVQRLLEEISKVIIVDNSPGSPTSEVLKQFVHDPRVDVVAQDGNVGVGAGFNAGMRLALQQGASSVWIFDQDSTVAVGTLARLLEARSSWPGAVGIVSPALRARTTGRVLEQSGGAPVVRQDVLISSGSLFSRDVLSIIGLHDEALFIDYVDHDICLRAVRSGYSNLKVYDAIMDHQFGASEPRRLLGRTVYVGDYSPFRQYYMVRNRMIMVRRYGFGRWFWEDLRFSAKSWIKVVALEDNRRAKLAAGLRGLRDGLRWRTR